MDSNWFQGKPGIRAAEQPIRVVSIDRQRLFGPMDYESDSALKDAVNTALLLDQPLLLSGEPGTGKTQLAEKLAIELGLQIFKFETKSSAIAQDLFYTFDHVARFQAAQGTDGASGALDPRRFIEFGALGRAIVQSLEESSARLLFADGELPDWYRGPQRAVVLIDEIDKAPSDFTNDALNEIERHFFRIREIDGGHAVHAEPTRRPIVVITSNSERQLPDAFLRRCIFHHIQPISRERLNRIVLRRLASLNVRSGPLLEDLLSFFFDIRTTTYDLRKRPSTAEFLGYVSAVFKDPAAAIDLKLTPALASHYLAALIKAPEDRAVVSKHPILAQQTA